MKKIIILLLTFALMVPCINVTAFAADEDSAETNNASTRYIDLFSKLGVFAEDYEATAEITRAQYAQMLAKLLNYDENMLSAMRGESYSDVSVDYTFSNEINLMNALGIMGAKEENKFCPEDKLTMDEAVMSMVRLLGYTIAAEDAGGYPKGYNQIADSLDICRGIPSELMTPYAAAGAIAKMFYNSLDVKIMNYNADKTLFKDYLKLKRGTGQVTAVYGLSLVGGKTITESGHVMIGGDTYETSVSNLSQYFGRNVEYYLQEDETGAQKVIYIREMRKSNEVTLYGGDLEDFKNNYIFYAEDDKTGYSKLRVADDAIIIYNGKLVAAMDKSYIPSNGSIRCISTDGGSAYNILVIFDYQSFVIDSAFNGTISFKYGLKFVDDQNGENKSIELKLDNSIIEKDGKMIWPDELSRNDVVSIAYSGGIYYVTVSTEAVKGVVRVVTGNPAKCYIDGKYYRVNKKFAEIAANNEYGMQEIKSGLNATFYIDAANEIVGMEIASSEMRYGYLKSVDSETNTVVIYNEADKDFAKFHINKKCIVNGENRSNIDDVFEELQQFITECKNKTKYNADNEITAFEPPVIKFKTSSDRNISALTTKTYKLAGVGKEPGVDEVERTTPLSDDYIITSPYSEKIWIASYNKITNFQSDLPTVLMKFVGTMQIPADGSKDNFDASADPRRILPNSDNKGINVILYDFDFEIGRPRYMGYIVGSTSTNVGIKSDIYGVESVGEAIDDGEVCKMLTMYESSTGNKVELVVSNKEELIEMCNTLKKGDFIQLNKDYKNRITAIAKLISYDRPDDYDKTVYTDTSGSLRKSAKKETMGVLFSRNISSKTVVISGMGTVSKFNIKDPKSDMPYVAMFKNKGLIYDGHSFYRDSFDCVSTDDMILATTYLAESYQYVVLKYNQNPYSEDDEFYIE